MYLSPAPAPNEIEVSVFGRGFGEALVIHLTNNKWVIVDSFLNPRTKEPVPIEYLDHLGVDLSQRVELIVASHWHADHVRGLYDIYHTCVDADFAISAAFEKTDFQYAVAALSKKGLSRELKATNDLYRTLELVDARQNQRQIQILHYAKAVSLIYTDRTLPYRCEVWAISPSERAFSKSLLDLNRLLEAVKERRTYRPKFSNLPVVVLLIILGEHAILLGSDLEETDDPLDGWSAILTSKKRPPGKSSMFKISHHGSVNGYHPDIWTKLLLADNTFAGLTPFINGDVRLPEISEIDRICGHTKYAYIAGGDNQPHAIPRNDVVRKAEKKGGQVTGSAPQLGHVRFRKDINDSSSVWDVVLDGAAFNLSLLQ